VRGGSPRGGWWSAAASSVAERSRRCGVARGHACRGDGDLGGVDIVAKSLGRSSMMPMCYHIPGSNKREE
jgi:hypothetical protein